MSQRNIRGAVVDVITIAIGISAVGISALALRAHEQPRQTVAVRDTSTVAVSNWPSLVEAGHRIGPVSAKVTIVEFGDFECPACGGFERALADLRKKYPRDIALVFRHWPLPYHRFAYPTARAAECAASQGRFESFHDLVYARQDSLGLITFDEFARRAGVRDLTSFAACSKLTGPVPIIETDIAAAKLIGSFGTPTVVINGRRFGHVPHPEEIEKLVTEVTKH